MKSKKEESEHDANKEDGTIKIKGFKKIFKTFKREQGFFNALKSIFKRDYIIKKAVGGISFNVNKGEILGFIGPNGAGKSTTIKAMCGILYPSAGRFSCNGFDPWTQRRMYVKHIGVIFGQKSQLVFDLPAIDIFHLHKEYYDIPDKVFKSNLKKMVSLLNIREVIKRPVRTLSLGERMKCEIVTALLHDPKIVFLDEPTIGLDIIAKERIRDFIKKINKEKGTTFIVTTHDMSDVEDLCERIVLINHGIIIYDGLLERVKEILKTKLIRVKLFKDLKNIRVRNCKVIPGRRFEFYLEVDLRKRKVNSVVKELIKKYKIVDITIKDPPIEEIIKIIYKSRKKIRL